MISVIITATNKFGDFATPLIEDINKYEPEVEIVLVDNASNPPYQVENVKIIRNNIQHSWSNMLNSGAKVATGDWLLMLNDDVRCTGKFSRFIESLDQQYLYGVSIRERGKQWIGQPVRYLYAWLMVMHRNLFDDVGGFDENYPAAGVDDIDFCLFAQHKGYKLITADFPFIHLADQPGYEHRRYKWDDVDFKERMEKSRQYFSKKVMEWSKD